jgi:hypothetical protein
VRVADSGRASPPIPNHELSSRLIPSHPDSNHEVAFDLDFLFHLEAFGTSRPISNDDASSRVIPTYPDRNHALGRSPKPAWVETLGSDFVTEVSGALGLSHEATNLSSSLVDDRGRAALFCQFERLVATAIVHSSFLNYSTSDTIP